MRRVLSALARPGDDSSSLTRRFVTRSALAFVVIGVVVHILVGRQVLVRYAAFADFHAEFVARSLLQHELAEAQIFDAPATEETITELRRFVDEYVIVGDVLRLKVWDTGGTILLSDDPALIGQTSPGIAGHLAEVIRSGTQTEQEHAEGGDDVGAVPDTMESYVPIVVNGQPAVVEVYQDLGPTMAAAQDFTRTFDAILALGLAGLWALLIPIVRRAASKLGSLLEREKETVQRLQELHDMKDTFLTAVSHELRTPLTVVKAGAQTLRGHGRRLDPEMHESIVDRIASNADRLERLLSSLLDLDRLARGTMEPVRERVDLRSLVDRVVQTLGTSRPIAVHVPHVRVDADPAQVERIVENLITNALRHTPDRTTVEVNADVDEDEVVLRVEDDGPGVPDDLKDHVFEPFVQGDLLRPASPGTGVGLALVERFARLNGGRAWVADLAGGGASFRVSLPRSTEDPGHAEVSDPQGVRARSDDLQAELVSIEARETGRPYGKGPDRSG